ncbi:unnamed protein product [Rodentolepis nana]|uniref:ATG11 domain-containing protein n=1 Tax=Rodentolepis nana TaxID=102285 RepID=A0A158QGK1_RODNA|nr:unnamed protein product [Rodentolepis nana]
MYVFLMSKCCLVNVDNSSLHERFSSLYTYLSQYYQLPYDRMILLSDGGNQLNHFNIIKDHDVGETCDNPIYVFVRESAISPAPFHGLPKKVLNYTDQPFSNILINDLQVYFKQIVSALDADVETIRQLEQDQRLMCFGWFIAQANFEHDLQGFQENVKSYWKEYEDHCSEVGRWEAIFNNFSAIKERLQSVPLLQSLLPTSSDVTNETINVYGPPRTLYDWMCHQTAHIVPRRPNASNLAGRVGSGFHLTSTASSSLDISAVPLNILCRNPSKLPLNTSFYLSTSSSSQGDGSTPSVVPSLESTLIELVEDSAAKLRMLNDSSGDMSMTNHKTSICDDGDTNSVLMMGDEIDDQRPHEDDKPMPLSTGQKLAFVYSKLKSFADLLDVAPRDAECLSHNEVHERDEVSGSIRIAQLNQESNYGFSSHSISPMDSSPLVRGQAANYPTSLPFMACPMPEHEIQQKPDSMENSDDGVVNWRCSKRNFSRHLDNLNRIQDAAQDAVRQVKDQICEVLLGLKNHEPLKAQKCRLLNIGKLLKDLGTRLQSIIDMKYKLADVISRLQVQLQSFSSEAMNKERECVRCFAYLSNISKCSAVLYQLQDSPELYVKCLLEIIRRRRTSSLWSSLNKRYTRYYAEFQHTESQRRESLAYELKDHLLVEIFRPLNTPYLPCLRFSHPGKQVSRISLISLSSSKRLSSNGKCLSTSQLNNPSPTAFRLSAANRPRTVIIPSNNEVLSNNSNNNSTDRSENSLPSINEAEVRELATRLPQDLATMITKALKELESEEYELMAGFHLGGSDDEMEDRLTQLEWQKQLRRRSRLFSSPGILAHGFTRQNYQIQAVDASTNTKEEPPKSPTSDKGVEANFEATCDQPTHSPPSPPSEPIDQSTDLYLSIEVSNFSENPISPSSASHNPSSKFFSPQGSRSEAETDPEGGDAPSTASDSLIAASYPRHLNEALTAQSATLRKLVEQLNTGLPTHLSVKLPTFTPGEETKYLNETVSYISQLVSQLEARKLVLVAPTSTASLPSSTESPTLPPSPPKISTKSVFTQASQQNSSQLTECSSRELPVTQATSISINEDIASLSNNLSSPIFHNNFAFSNFRSENLVIFIPVVVSAKNQPNSGTMNDVPVGEDALTTGGGISFWGKQSLRLLSSDIISSSLAPSSATGAAVEQWRMLSNDGLVYFLHDDDFEDFNVARSACQPAASALCRTGEPSQTTLLPEPVLPLARRAVPFVIGVFQRKEKCISKKDENRFGLPRDFVFFRVRARSL